MLPQGALIYIYMYIYIYMCVCMCIYICICISVRVYTYTTVSLHVTGLNCTLTVSYGKWERLCVCVNNATGRTAQALLPHTLAEEHTHMHACMHTRTHTHTHTHPHPHTSLNRNGTSQGVSPVTDRISPHPEVASFRRKT